MTDDKFAAFDAAVIEAMTASSQPGDSTLVAKITAIDAALSALPTDAVTNHRIRTSMDVTLTTLLGQPAQLERFGFAATLGTGGQGPYFAKLMLLCKERAATLAIDALLSVIGSLRRAKLYTDMDVCVRILDKKMSALRSKATYDEAMSFEQRAKAAATQIQAGQYYERALQLAEKSAQEAMAGGDPVGRLYALTIGSGLVLPELGQWQESIAMSAEISRDARAIYVTMEAGDARTRVERIDMNATFHRINITVKHGGNADDIPQWLGELAAIPVYQASRGEDWAKGYVKDANEYLASKKPS